MDFKFLDEKGAVVATAEGACAAQKTFEQRAGISPDCIVLDDTGIEISAAVLKVLCDAERQGATADS